MDGVVQAISGAAGQHVDAGAVIAELGNAAVERDAEVARTQLALIDAHIRRSGAPASAPRRAPAESLQASAKILELRRDRFETMKELRRTNDVTARDLQQAEAEYLAALRDHGNERRAGEVAPAARDLEVLQLERQKAVADQKFAAHRQTLLTVRTPFAGVLTQVHVAPGQAIYPRDPIADVADLSTLRVHAPIGAELLRHVRTGMRVDVKVASTPERTVSATIDAIVPASPGAAAGSPSIVVTIPNPGSSLPPGTQATVTLLSDR